MLDKAYVYDGSLEALLTAVFTAYERREHPTDIMVSHDMQPRLGQEVCEISLDMEKAIRVHNGLVKAYNEHVFDAIKHASLSDDPHKGTIIYQFIRYAMSQKHKKWNILDDLSCYEVMRLQQLSRSVYNERHYIMQFLRFEHMENDLWYAKCNPKASVVPLVMDWFSARFNTQAFMIYDEVHNIAGVYEGKDWHLVKSDQLAVPDHAPDEHLMQSAWKKFYDTIAVESRYNPELRVQLMPKRFWANMTEMQEIGSASHHAPSLSA